MKKRILTLFMAASLAAIALVGCGAKEEANKEVAGEVVESDFDYDNDIAVISREELFCFVKFNDFS